MSLQGSAYRGRGMAMSLQGSAYRGRGMEPADRAQHDSNMSLVLCTDSAAHSECQGHHVSGADQGIAHEDQGRQGGYGKRRMGGGEP